MLPDSKISQLISLQIPGLSYVMQQAPVSRVMRTFTEYTRNMIRAGQLSEARRCFNIAAVLYRNGSRLLQTAIENVYLYGLSPLLDTTCSNRPVKELLPLRLRNIHVQHYHSL